MLWTEEDTKNAMQRLNDAIDKIIKRVISEGYSRIVARDGKLLKIHPDGTEEVLKELPPHRSVPAGTVFKIRKGA